MGIFDKSSATAHPTTPTRTATTVIADGCHINGELQLACDIQVDGSIEGKLRLDKTLIVSQSGRLKGEIYADKIIVNGKIEGSCYANAIEILNNGQITGTIYCDDMSIERGGKFLGSTHPAEKEQVVTLPKKDSKEKVTAKAKQAAAQ